MTDIFAPEGYHLLLGISGYSLEAEHRNVMAFLSQRVAAMSLHGSTHSERTADVLRHAGIPICETSTLSDKPIDMAVGYSNEVACYAMVEHLARCGYRKIAFMSAPVLNNDRIMGRLIGYTNAVKALGLFQAPTLALETPIGIASGGKGFVELMSRHPDLDAVFCADDTLAFGSMLEARRRGIGIPDDVGIAGFADVELAQEFVPALTTVRLKRYEMGVAAARLLLRRLRGETPERTTVDLGFEIIARGSTRRPKT
jgi:LacI family gluconate utilization system Gnt-I transcriptional repressor